MDINFYKNYYKDLSHMDDNQLIHHYNEYGRNEGRIFSQKELNELIETTGKPDFDPNYYGSYYTDLSHMNFKQLVHHYNEYGRNEGRKICDDNKIFDIDFYKSYYLDLRHMTKEELIRHYNEYGRDECRFININYLNIKIDLKDFKNKNLTFDIDFYRKINNLENLDENKIILHYNYVGNIINNFSSFNTKKEDSYRDNANTNFRRIDNYKDLVNCRNNFVYNYYICNIDSFYKYYVNFDLNCYKNKYFLNSELNEKDILIHYHKIGKYNKEIINDKINIILYTPGYYIKCGGIIVMHYLCKIINERYNDFFTAKLFNIENMKYENEFCNNFATLEEINEETIVIYPEVIKGNPLNAKNVIRWILLDLGIEMSIDHYKNWNKNDLVYYWEKKNKQLSCPYLNPLFKNNNLSRERNKTCYLLKKGRIIHENINYINPPDSICIDDLSLEEINDIFNQSKYFYCYDTNTCYIIYAAICGCVPIIYPKNGINEKEFFENRIFNFNNTIYNKGIVYGYDENKINNAKKEINECEKFYKDLFDMYGQKVEEFLEDLKKLKNEMVLENTVNNIYY